MGMVGIISTEQTMLRSCTAFFNILVLLVSYHFADLRGGIAIANSRHLVSFRSRVRRAFTFLT
jgi:hypothetical protein